MKKIKKQLKHLKYDEYRNWLKRIYLLTIKECYEQKDYKAIERVIWNYNTIVAIIKLQDPLYRDKSSLQIQADRGFLGVKGRFIFKEKSNTSTNSNSKCNVRKPLSEENIQKQIADIKRAETWFKTITPIPEDTQTEFDGSTWKRSI